MQLQEIQQILDSEKFGTSLHLASEEVAIDQLFVNLKGNTQDFLLEIAYLPHLEQELDNTQLLQFFVALPDEVKPSVKDNLRKLLLQLNFHVPLMGWGFYEEDNLLYFRHVLVLSKQANSSDQAPILESVWLIFFLLDSFYSTITECINSSEEF